MIVSQYGIIHLEHGVLVKGYIPCREFFYLQNLFKKAYGYDFIDDGIAHVFKATLCLTTKQKSKEWRKVLELVIDSGNTLRNPRRISRAVSF